MRQPVQAVNDRITQVKVPLPFPLRWINSYVVRGANGYTIIDPGLHTEDAVRLWEQAMKELGFEYEDVEKIVLTHHHPDHYGLAGSFQQRSGKHPPVYMSQKGKELADLLWGSEEPTMTTSMPADFIAHGMDRQTADEMVVHMDSFIPLVSPQPEVTYMEEDAPFALGDRWYRPIHTPGHAEGHLCFLDESNGEMFCGDHVLPQITPNVSYIPGGDPNPLSSFLSSLELAARLPVSMAMPGHRDPFTGFVERARDIIQHHEVRLAQIADGLKKPATAYQVCRHLFGDRLSIHQLRFAMGETIAHMIYLEQQGRVVLSTDDEGIRRYHRP
jgi:glyoxylase-like metal-dependent hydrolase (beta-lactamase superfamily II)